MNNEFNWQNCWYPVVFCTDLPTDKPYPFELYGEALVLFYDEKKHLSCLRDRCPHRAARLSDGQIVDGKLECLYHGWQFDHSGRCVHIPQLHNTKPLPARACTRSYPLQVVQGIVWIWAGDEQLADPTTIPAIENFEAEGMYSVDYLVDLPYDQTYLIENIIDIAHIHVAHHGLRGGGHRSLAMPLEFDVAENSPKGIFASYRSVGLEDRRNVSSVNRANISFVAPNLIHYTTDYKNNERIAGLALYSLPIKHGRCRLLYRKYSNFYSWKERIKPRFLEHWVQNTILQQDMALIIGQYDEIERSGLELRDVWLPLKSSDTLVIQYRQWLDKYAGNAPMFRGFTAHSNTVQKSGLATQSTNVFDLHTRHCTTCTTLHRRAGLVRNTLLLCIALLLPILLTVDNQNNSVYLIIYVLCVLLLAGNWWFRRKFE